MNTCQNCHKCKWPIMSIAVVGFVGTWIVLWLTQHVHVRFWWIP